jgi:hypothetical protein
MTPARLGAIPPRWQSAVDLLQAGDDVLSVLETTAGLIRRHREQARMYQNARPTMRPYHRWRRDRLAERIRNRLGLAATAPIPEIG